MGYKKGEQLKTAFETYIVQGQKGCGGSGEVYEVRNSDGALFAAKILDQNKSTASRLKRFRNEINFCSRIDHPNIVPVLGHGIARDQSTFYIMPLYSGTLRDLVLKGIPAEAVLRYFGQILDGVEAAHFRGVWHRDLKPENILFSAQSDTLVIADFGVAHFEEEELLTAVETRNADRLANFIYSAPEQKVRGRVVTEKADVYALGLILNQMFTNEVPLGTQFKAIAGIRPDYAYLDDLVDNMMRQEPAQRPSIEAVKLELIARRQRFISLQKINQLSKTVVSEDSITDPLVVDPIRATNFDYRDGYLLVTLSREPNHLWIQWFQNQPTTSFLHKGPSTVSFQGLLASVPANKDIVVQQRDYFKTWVDGANRLYTAAVETQLKKDKQQREQELKKKLEQEEKRQEILKMLNAP
jgi:serine/threonine protein kinase